MPLQQLLTRFDAIGPMGTTVPIVVDQTFTGSAELTAIFRSVLRTDALTITALASQCSRGDDHLRLVGTASLLGMTEAQVSFAATAPGGELLVTMEILVPADWSFSDTFPALPGHDTGEVWEATGDKGVKPSFLTQLSLGTCRLYFASAACYNEALGRTLPAGLSFAGEMYLNGALYPLSLLVAGTDPLALAGPLTEFREVPDPSSFAGIRLTAPLTAEVETLGPLTIRAAQLYLKSGTDPYQRDYVVSVTQEAGIYLLVGAELDGRPLDMVGGIDAAGASGEVSIRGVFRDFAVAGFSSLSQKVGVDGFDNSVPTDFPAPEGLSLTELGVSLDPGRLAVTSLTVGVGMDTHWDIVPGVLRLAEIGVTFVVADPFSSPSILTSVTGLLDFSRFSLAASAEFPSFRIVAGLPLGETIPLGDLVESLLGGGMDVPEMTIAQLLLTAVPGEGSFSGTAQVQDVFSIPVGSTALDLNGLVVSVEREGGVTRGLLSARMSMGGAAATVSGELNQRLTLSGGVRSLDLKAFWSEVTGGESLPEQVPDVVIENLGVTCTPSTGDFSLLGSVNVAWDHLPGGDAISTNLQFSLTRTAGVGEGSASKFTASISLTGTGPVHVAEGFTLGSFNFLFGYATGAGWKLSGGIAADVLDTSLNLQASFEDRPTGQKIALRAMASPEATLVDLSGVGEYRFKQLDLTIDRPAGVDGKQGPTFFDLRLASTLKVDGAFTVGGYLSVKDAADGSAGLVFNPYPSDATVHVSFPTGEGVGAELELFEIGVVKGAGAGAGWSFTGTVIASVTGVGGWAGSALPSRMTAKLVVGADAARVSAVNVTDPAGFSLGHVDGKPLGTAYVQVNEIGIALWPSAGLVLETGIGLPAELNTFLGSQLFRVYEKGNPLTMARARFTIAGTGISMQLVSSPFTGVNAISVRGEAWFDVDFGKYGAIQMKLPTFVYDGVSQYWEASGGCRISKPLAVPLTPLKAFLRACGMEGAAKIFPDAVPVTEISLVDRNDDLKTDELVSFLKSVGEVPNEVVKAVKAVGDVLNRFPDGFKHYLTIQVPTALDFKFGFSPSGRVSLGLIAANEPVKVLFPSVVMSYVPMPGLVGMELHKLTLGTLSSGSLFFGEIDAVIDQFDLPSLALSLMLPADDDFPLPTSDQLQRRITLNNVFCLVPAGEGEPIPIPVFYDQIGFDYLGVEGLGLGAHLRFPKPQLGGAQAAEFVSTFKDFIGSRKSLLDPKSPPGDVDLAFTFRDEFVQAPEYLGGAVLGTKGKDVTVGTWKYTASMLNFLKTFSIDHMIASIPQESRVGSASYRFAFLEFDADWLLTTPAEFRAGAFEHLSLTDSDRQDFFDVLPSVATTSGGTGSATEEGLVAFVRGGAELGFVKLDAAFGLAASGSMGFNTGFKLYGAIGSALELELRGAVMVNAPLAADGSLVTSTKAISSTSSASSASTDVPAALATSFVGVVRDRALTLDGKKAWVQVPASDSLKLNEYTVELWIRPAAGQTGEWIEVFGIDTLTKNEQRNFFLEINAKQGFYGHRFKDAKSGNSGAPNTAAGSVSWGRWQHVALVNDGTTAKTYLDGVEAASGPVSGLVPLSADVYMGKIPGSGKSRFFAGDYAEVRVWKRARTADEIAAQMHDVLAGSEKDLVSCWRFDTDTGTRAVDSCGRNHGTINGGRFIATDLLALEGIDFDGSADYAEVPDSTSLRVPGAYTLEAWFRPQAMTADWAGVAGKKGRCHALFINKSGFAHHRFHDKSGTNGGAPNTAAGSIAFGRWNHVAIVNDGKTARTFINGALATEGAVNGSLIAHNTAMQFGRTADGAANAFFPGTIAEVRLWSTARSADEVKASMYRRIGAAEDGIVGLWRFGEATGAVLPDACGRNPAALHVAARTEPARLRHDGLVLDGASDYALLPKSEAFKLPQYTVEAWIRPEQPAGTWECVLGGGGSAPKLYLNANGMVSHRYVARGQTTKTTTQKVKTPMGTVTVPVTTTVDAGVRTVAANTDAGAVRWGEWNHVAVTNDGATWRTFVNGAEAKSGAVDGALLADAVEINVGRSDEGKAEAFFRGGIDDVRIWNVARTADQVAASMSTSLAGTEAGLVAWYDMDHTAGAVLTDRGPNALHGTVAGARWALAAAPAEPERAALQVLGHTHLTVAGHKAMVADLRIVNGEVWFAGLLDLFPGDWPIRVAGHVEGMVSGSRFYLSGDTDLSLFGLKLVGSRLFASNDEMRLEGHFLGAFLLLDVAWSGSDPHFAGSVGYSAHPTLNFGTVYIAGVKVGTNVRIDVDLGLSVAVRISKQGFAADVAATFRINGVGFSLSLSLDVPPGDLDDLVNWVAQHIIDEPAKYLAHLFADAAAWLAGVASGAIEFAKDAAEVVGAALKNAYGVTKEALGPLMKGAGYTAAQVGTALGKAYGVAADAAATLLRDARFVVNDIAGALRDSFGKADADCAKILAGVGYRADEVAGALKSAYGSAEQAVTKLLYDAKYAVNDIAGALSSTFGTGAQRAAQLFKDLSYRADEVAGVLKNVYRKADADCANVLKAVNYGAEQATAALSSVYNIGASRAATVLKGAGYAANDVGNALKSTYKLTDKACAQAMKDARYAADEVGNALKSAYGTSADAAASVMKDVGYASSEVSGTMQNVYGKSKKEAEKLLGSAGDAVSSGAKTVAGWFS